MLHSLRLTAARHSLRTPRRIQSHISRLHSQQYTEHRSTSQRLQRIALGASVGLGLVGLHAFGQRPVQLEAPDKSRSARSPSKVDEPVDTQPSEPPSGLSSDANGLVETKEEDVLDKVAESRPKLKEYDENDEGGESEGGESGGGAFNPETGEINWDCPCLGGMAHGPCGQEFRAAFSCFVFSEAEPKGVNCVELFKAMQGCFREHPDVYGEDIMAEDEEEPSPASSTEGNTETPSSTSSAAPTAS